MRTFRLRTLLGVTFFATALAGCGGSNAPVSPLQGQPAGSGGATSSYGETVSAALSTTSTKYAIPLSGGYSASISLHSNSAAPGTKLLIGVRQPVLSDSSRLKSFSKSHSCPTTLTIPLYNPFWFAITLNVDNISLSLPCSVDGMLFGVSFYQLQPAPPVASSLKVGDIKAMGNNITFTSTVATITLPANTETALTITPEATTSEVAIPLSSSGGSAQLTSNASTLPSSLTIGYGSGGGGGSLFSSGCNPAFNGGTLAGDLAKVSILGVPQYYCTLGTVNSSTVTFGNSSGVTFTIGTPLADRSFVGIDGASQQFACGTPSTTTTCSVPEPLTVPTVQNVIVGNAEDMQICLPAVSTQNCNSNAGPTTGSTLSQVPPWSEFDVLVADDPTYTATYGQVIEGETSLCSAMGVAPCGGFAVSVSGQCVLDNGGDDNGDVPPGYSDPGGPDEAASPPPTSTSATFPAKFGPFAEFDIIAQGPGSCSIQVAETAGPAQPLRMTLPFTITIATGATPAVRTHRAALKR